MMIYPWHTRPVSGTIEIVVVTARGQDALKKTGRNPALAYEFPDLRKLFRPDPGGIRCRRAEYRGPCQYPPRINEESRETYYEALNRSSDGWHEGAHDAHHWLRISGAC